MADNKTFRTGHNIKTIFKERLLDDLKSETASGYAIIIDLVSKIVHCRDETTQQTLKEHIIKTIGEDKFNHLWTTKDEYTALDETIRYYLQLIKENRGKTSPELIETLMQKTYEASTKLPVIRDDVNQLFMLCIESTDLKNQKMPLRSFRQEWTEGTARQMMAQPDSSGIVNPVDITEE